MSIEEIVEAYLDGRHPEVPAELQTEYDLAVRGYAALQFAIGETIIAPNLVTGKRSPPQLPDDYELKRELGCGGMGVVYLANQKSLGRDVAVKVLRPGEATYSPLIRRFLDEARHLARLKHPNIVSIHEIGEASSEPYFTMDYVEGESLDQLLARGPLSPSQALTIFKQAATGIQHAHARGIIHRDLKPGNILLDTSGHAFVSDFGLARNLSHDAQLTRSGEIVGTPTYMAPEQARGKAELIGEATDIFALGAILYEMLAGRPPFGADSAVEVLMRLLNEEPVPLRQVDRRIPRDLETICLKALAKRPDDRYASVGAMLEDVRRHESGEPVFAKRPSVIVQLAKRTFRHWKVASLVAGTALVMLVLFATYGSRLFDKTTEELMGWGDEAHQSGEYLQAIEVYRRALAKATEQERPDIVQRIVRSCSQIEGSSAAVDSALEVLKLAPHASFGKHDFLVAQALYTQTLERHPNLSSSSAERCTEEIADLRRLIERYNLVIDSNFSSPRQREIAASRIEMINGFLYSTFEEDREQFAGTSALSNTDLPHGDVGELREIAADSNRTNWERGLAAYALGLKLEELGDAADARSSFAQSLELIRADFPYTAGISSSMKHSKARGAEHLEDKECELVRQILAAHQRMNSSVEAEPVTSLTLRITGVDLPDEVVVKIGLRLVGIDEGSRGRHAALPSSVPVVDQTASVNVLNGAYRLSVTRESVFSPPGMSDRFGGLLALDLAGLPGEVELTGAPLTLEIPARFIEEIELQEPSHRQTFDLRTGFLRWTGIDGAAYYRVMLLEKEAVVGGGTKYRGGPGIQTLSTSLCLGTLSPAEQVESQWMRPGMTINWQINAYDEQDQLIGTTTESERVFLVGAGLSADDNQE